MSKKDYVSGLLVINIPNGVCDTCQLGKKHRDSFPTGKSWRARKQLEIVHSDLCTVEVPSHGDCRYFITFIDDSTKYYYLYLLKSKDEAIEKFTLYKKDV